jgi:hypothetical protein
VPAQNSKSVEKNRDLCVGAITVVGMIAILSALVCLLSFRVRHRASLELELVALRHQVSVLRRQRKGRLQLFATDQLLWVWLYRIWPQVLNAMVLVKPGKRDPVESQGLPALLALAIRIAPSGSTQEKHQAVSRCGDLRRSMLSWGRRTRISACNAVRDRNSPIKAHHINLQRSLIGSEY